LTKILYDSNLFIIGNKFIQYFKKEFNMTVHTSKFSKYQHTASPDSQDIRDKYYEPDIIALKSAIACPSNLVILDQGREGSCTGFGLAAVINLLKQRKGDDQQVSQRMLYEMAKHFDRWPGEAYEGSSCRGAILGWYNTGVCSDEVWPYIENDNTGLNITRSKDAKNTTLGAFYRLNHKISDVHAALNMVGVIYVSADIHSGWYEPDEKNPIISSDGSPIGGHAFAIVGYNSDGFFVQNSWGTSWGENGVALWKYEDWHENVKDMWVVRLALSTPQLFSLVIPSSMNNQDESVAVKKAPIRASIAGHFVHIDDGYFDDNGKYWSNLYDIKQTANFVAESDKYEHILLYAHGGLNNTDASANRVSAMKSTFKANNIYPFHFMYDTGLLEEIKDIVLGKKKKVSERAMGFTDLTDKLIENLARKPGRAIWNEMKKDASLPFKNNSYAGFQTLVAFLNALAASNKPKKIHLVGHSTGGILIGHLLDAIKEINNEIVIDTCSLMAPACSIDLYNSSYLPLLNDQIIKKMRIYNLSEKLEKDDNVARVYRKSLLFLVSNSFEKTKRLPLLGMKKFNGEVQPHPNLNFLYSEGSSSNTVTQGTSHGGFDNDPVTMNDILKNILAYEIIKPFTKKALDF